MNPHLSAERPSCQAFHAMTSGTSLTHWHWDAKTQALLVIEGLKGKPVAAALRR
jgi:hypothetical protein